ncbi:MAG: 2-dehydro-3-deoxygalactonokinase [Bacillota bacterium]
MFAIIDSGTTNTRIYIIEDDYKVIASGNKKVGVRDTSITGSRDMLKNGVSSLFFEIMKENNIDEKRVKFAIASGMITSEIGLIEIPHLVAPIGLKELSESIEKVEDNDVLPISRPIYFIRGIKNNFPKDARIHDLRLIDFMRGEEVQWVGAVMMKNIAEPCNVVTLSSHTKVMYIDDSQRLVHSITTLSGQFFEAITSSTNIGKSVRVLENERENIYTQQEVIEVARMCVEKAGLGRTLLMPRFMETLLNTNSQERIWFLDAAIAADDMKAFDEMIAMGLDTNRYILYGHELRCNLYEKMLHMKYGDDIIVESISKKEDIDNLTIQGVIQIARDVIRKYN